MTDSSKRAPGIDFALLAFIAAACLLAFGFGLAAAKFKLLPYRLAEEAVAAAKAIVAYEPDEMMEGFMGFDAAAPAQPVAKMLASDAGTEPLLVVGGPYQYMQQCPTFGCLAWVVDRQGQVLHKWEVDLDKLFGDITGFDGRIRTQNFYPVGMALQDDGGLVVSFHGRNTYPYQAGVARFAADGSIMWKHFDNSHHWLITDAAGKTYIPSSKRVTGMKYFGNSGVETQCTGQMFVEGVNVYSADGKLLRNYPLIEALDRGAYRGLFYALRDSCDPLHINSVDLVTPTVARALPGVKVGDMLVSLREPNAVGIIDAEDGHFKKLVVGRTAAQHSAVFLPDGTALALDNQGGEMSTGGTRVARINFVTNEVTTVFPRAGSKLPWKVRSTDGGRITVSPDGKRAMVSLKDESRTVEIEIATGRALWTSVKGFDVSPYLKKFDITADVPRGFFKPYGSYYVPGKGFEAAAAGMAVTPAVASAG